MSDSNGNLKEFHWLVEVLQTVDVGVLVLDLDYTITAWNGFIENNSGIDSAEALGKSLFDVFPEVSIDWFKHKADTVVQLRNRAFTTWEQRPYIFKFRNNRPITGVTKYMYQNCTFIPVVSTTGVVENLAVIVYDVTDAAASKIKLKKANEQLAHLSRTDALTQLNNRGYWETLFESEFRRQQRNPRELSLIMFDVDHFKNVNDTWGHQAGDDVIRSVADRVRNNSRATDISGRYGGDEFVILLLDSDIENANLFSERLRSDIEQMNVKVDSQTLNVTVSLGVTSWSSEYENHSQWIEAADQALYKAKESGRNKTVR